MSTTHQHSDFAAVAGIGIAAAMIVASLFALEGVAGVPISVRGEQVYRTQTYQRLKRTRKPSQTANRRAARSNSAATVASFLAGNPQCMKVQACTDELYRTITQPNCKQDADCRKLSALYTFFYANRGCITIMTAECREGVQNALTQ